ncbi:polyprenyl diphosphate synthase [Buchnera aphidicola]|uniref:Ditrans,polycis-undecaprenyl-diphosphate synthase ((2E,6E)-farnesyl-diphosphate specific) n=1 Tax=Buchnera aphidicola subsp. Acyrthosiphon pisum (strain 5A) TaxID=563178 RepID=A0A7U3YAC8_BUCA5|nr:polyprenyl diphosphate synthase [Buchnera aphidicola]ADP66632.1 undecaprenyl pyrophosphate synthetase [Buchnera aphidicola str. TLW03 (Acyrthosiphon pisum)]ADP67749.1 undecaprenyl pyrophosphate synthetase [Buchnera aphidicola str. JF98 (Acyrthosiphon pisum)]OQX99850.1 MAG: di-trans,poly-cis-decaprenylcistransferase [Erwiniaceae bacterium 4572_131]ACL30052.1 undecaprenyl pyrophosphate synthetase [Buchnera aphidicola str. Tuc7 (Acyrthosiphon pisum)]ACL30604.1 undecaprenyl pyrophosphate synthe
MQYKYLLEYNKKNHECNPCHVAIIMDGNGRWATRQGKIRIMGHKEGFRAVKEAIKFSIANNLKILTLYAFSSENWNRPLFEIKALMELFLFALDTEIKNLKKHNIRFKVIGDITCFDKKLQNSIHYAEQITFDNTGLILNIAANYGGRWDIIESVKKIINRVQRGILDVNKIQENTISQYLSTSELLPVDLVIRTGGEKRISNFLLWQIAYSELYFTDVLWPDFNCHIFQHAIDSFVSRERRFGGFKKNKK